MTIYKCGHKAEPQVVKDSPMVFAEYLAWRDRNRGRMCFPCWCKETEKEIKTQEVIV